MAVYIEAVLTPHRLEVVSVRQGDLVLRTMEECNPDLVILDVFMPLISGFDVCRQIRGSRFSNVPILFTTAHTSRNVRLACFRAGGDDFIQKPLIEEELVARVSARLQRVRRAHQVDATSGALTRAAFLSAVGSAWDAGAAAIVAINHFKSVNATHGFEAGDAVLRGVTDVLRRAMPPGVLIGRWGSDEIVVVLPGESRTTITALMQRTLRQIEVASFQSPTGQPFGVTCRIGAAGSPRDGTTPHAILSAADLRVQTEEAPGTSTPPPAPSRLPRR
jgi:diguanylate cyclase (GGDEF)-like protein